MRRLRGCRERSTRGEKTANKRQSLFSFFLTSACRAALALCVKHASYAAMAEPSSSSSGGAVLQFEQLQVKKEKREKQEEKEKEEKEE